MELYLRGVSNTYPNGVRALKDVSLAIPVVVGIGAAIALDPLTGQDLPGTNSLIPAVAVIMIVVGFFAALGPARRGLNIQPIDALKTD